MAISSIRFASQNYQLTQPRLQVRFGEEAPELKTPPIAEPKKKSTFWGSIKEGFYSLPYYLPGFMAGGAVADKLYDGVSGNYTATAGQIFVWAFIATLSGSASEKYLKKLKSKVFPKPKLTPPPSDA